MRQPGTLLHRHALGAVVGAMALLALMGAPPLRAQVSAQQHTLSRVSFARSDCAADAPPVLLDIDLLGLNDPPYVYAELLVPWTGSGTSVTCPAYRLAEPVHEILPEQTLEAISGRYLETFSLTPPQVIGAAACEEPGVRRVDLALCLYVVDANLGEALRTGLPIRFDTEAPPAPLLERVEPGAGQLSLTLAVPDTEAAEVAEVRVQFRACTMSDAGVPDDAGALAAGTETGDGGTLVTERESLCDSPLPYQELRFDTLTLTLDSLENGVEYEIRAAVQDDFGNAGPFSEAFLATPRPELGVLELYDGQGSPYSFTPSCQSAGGGSAGWCFGACALLLAARRRRRSSDAAPQAFSAALVVVLLAGAGPLRAEVVPAADAGSESRHPLSFGVSLAPYAPRLDDEKVAGRAIFPIYQCFFQNQRVPEAAFQVGVSLLENFGTLELQLGGSFAQVRGLAQPVAALSAGEGGGPACLDATEGSVELTLVKLRPGVAYRFTPLLDAYEFPLVPYVRTALVLAGYAFSSRGQFASAGASLPRDPAGFVLGAEAALGLQVSLAPLDRLDPFTPLTVRRARANRVFQHAFVFAELLLQPLDNFGSPGFVFSPQDPFFGSELPLTAHFGLSLELP